MQISKIVIYLLGATVCLISTITAEPIIIKASDLDHLFITIDPGTHAIRNAQVLPWDSTESTAFQAIIAPWPESSGVFFGFPPWYTNMARTVISVPGQGITFAALADVKAGGIIRPLLTKWKQSGDYLELLCVSEDFPEMGGAIHFEECRSFPDSSLFLIVRSAGGDMEQAWTRFSMVLDDGNCRWLRFQDINSTYMMFQPSFAETWCELDESGGHPYRLKILQRRQEADGPANADGSYNHKAVGRDSTFVDLWEAAKKARQAGK